MQSSLKHQRHWLYSLSVDWKMSISLQLIYTVLFFWALLSVSQSV
uniref:Uncharacterized protein n=1 Tax=Anguilla anguilla TaxID=7936 RepID=A0A0E9SNV6_ANGAN